MNISYSKIYAASKLLISNY